MTASTPPSADLLETPAMSLSHPDWVRLMATRLRWLYPSLLERQATILASDFHRTLTAATLRPGDAGVDRSASPQPVGTRQIDISARNRQPLETR